MSPLATSAAPRLTPFFVAIVGMVLIGSGLRRGMQWRRLLPRNAALVACLLFATYVFLNAIWSVDPLAGIGKAALLMGLVLVTFAAIETASALDERILGRAAIAFAAGALVGVLFIMLELLTHGIVIRTVAGWVPSIASPKHFDTSNGVLTKIHLSKLDQNVNVAMFNLWPGLLALMGLASTRRTMATVVFFAAIAAVIARPNMTPHKSH